MKIVTLTLNPAFDVHCHVPAFAPYHENLATVTSRDAGGKGVNISRALTRNGVENTAIVVLGKENAADFRRALAAEGIVTCEIEVEGRIRENITIHTDSAPETRISFAGAKSDASLFSRVQAALSERAPSDGIVTFTGSLPSGVSVADAKRFLAETVARGTRIVIDSKSFSLTDLLECRPWLIKPNEEEIAAYLGRSIETLADAADAARELHRAGVENAMISLGGRGAVLACTEGTFAAVAPVVQVKSTIGAGDSAIAGFLAATAQGRTGSDALRMSVAFGSAACLSEGTQPPRAEDVCEFMKNIEIREVLFG